MDKNMDMNGFAFPSYMNMDNMGAMGYDPMASEGPLFNPIMQYEQAYMYYRYLTQQLEYKMKCKEYEKMCSRSEPSRTERRVE